MPIFVSDITYSGLRIAGILGAPERGSDLDNREALRVLNTLLDSLKTERLIVWQILRTVFDTINGQGEYTIGPSGADWTLARPERIEQAGWIFINTSPNVEIPIEILNTQKWAAVSPKGITGPVATKLYYEAFVPNGTIHLWPKPIGTWQVALYTWQTVEEFAALTDEVVFPPGYRKMLEYCLAIELAARFPERQRLAPMSVNIAREAKAMVRNANSPVLYMQTDSGAMGIQNRRGGFRIRSNSYSSGDY